MARLFNESHVISSAMGHEGNIDFNEALEQVIRGELSDADIEAVYARPDYDEDGDAIVHIIVVFKSNSKFDPKKAKSLTHHIFPVLKQGFRDAFPIISFRSKADHARLSAAA